MTVRMANDEALVLIDEARIARRAVQDGDTAARVALLLSAARIANDDTALGDPDMIVNGDGRYERGLATPSLTHRERMQWFATLIEAVADVDRLVAWRGRTAKQHHTLSPALDACITTAVDRATLAVAVLLYGEPELEAVA